MLSISGESPIRIHSEILRMPSSLDTYAPSPLGITLDASVWFFAGRTDETDAVRHVPIHSLPFRIGRRPDLSLTLPSNCVSKEHAEIFARDGQMWVRDLGSTNGTYVNGARDRKSVV